MHSRTETTRRLPGTFVQWAVTVASGAVLGVALAVLQHHGLLGWMPDWMKP